jgi:O-antigen ligase
LITAGPIKPVFDYLKAPIDWTLLVFCLILADILFASIFFKNKIVLTGEKLLAILPLGLFSTLILFSLIYTPSMSYGREKTLLFGVTLLFFIYPLFIRKLNLNILNALYLFVIVPIVVWFISYKFLYFSPMNSGYGIVRIEFYEIRNKYLGLGMLICFFTLVQLFMKKTPWFILLSIILLLGLGSRGSLLFLLTTLLIWKWKEIFKAVQKGLRMGKRTIKILAYASVLVVPVLYFKFNQIAQVFYLGLFRFKSLIGPGADVSSQGRISRMVFAFESIFSGPRIFIFGNGIGSFGLLYGGVDEREYPHNLLLEVWFELGVIALVVFLFFLVFPFYLRRPNLPKVLAICFLFHAMKSGDLGGLWTLFFAYGLLIFNPEYENGNK